MTTPSVAEIEDRIEGELLRLEWRLAELGARLRRTPADDVDPRWLSHRRAERARLCRLVGRLHERAAGLIEANPDVFDSELELYYADPVAWCGRERSRAAADAGGGPDAA
jgi:hypothetical protein